MFGSTVLETAIGMAFVFLLVSILVTAASEMLANGLQLRARCLRKGLAAMLAPGDSTDEMMTGLEIDILQHPLVAGRAVPTADAAAKAKPPGKGSGPSYIQTQVFSSALLDTLGLLRPSSGEWVQKLQSRLAALPATGEDLAPLHAAVSGLMEEMTEALDGADLRASLEKAVADLSQIPAAALALQNPAAMQELQKKLAEINAKITPGMMLNWVKPTLTEIARKPTAQALQDLIAQIPATGAGCATFQNRLKAWRDRLTQTPLPPYALAVAEAKSLTSSLTNMGAALDRLPDSDLKRSLLLLFREAGNDADAFKAKVGEWFDASMNRVSGWYKRQTAWVNFTTGAVLAVLLNVDALLVLKRLSTDPSVRAALVNEASTYADKASAAGTDKTAATPADTATVLPAAPPATASGAATQTAPTPAKSRQHFQEAQKQLEELGLPIGWVAPGSPEAANPRALAEQRQRPSGSSLLNFDGTAWLKLAQLVRTHGIGWLLTAIAASLGAPFWFDLLSKFMNVRHAGERPDARGKPAPTPAA